MLNFEDWFEKATGHKPYPFQVHFACDQTLFQHASPQDGEGGDEGVLVDVPTGLGKTAMAVLGWLWRRRFHPDAAVRRATPRRLVYCLPMRVLVEQTYECALDWLEATCLLAGSIERELQKNGERGRVKMDTYRWDTCAVDRVGVHVLMGGEEAADWDIYPEREQIVVGTQDMLLSRALNRGYAASRSRWPIQFGLLNTDCLWVFDEIQLMGAGLATTAQLEAFRRLLPDKGEEAARNGHGCCSVWMSATMRRDWLRTVDFAPFLDTAQKIAFDFEKEINAPELDEKARKALQDRWHAKKPLAKAEAAIGNAAGLAQEVRKAHKPGTRTIAIVNTVKRACALSEELQELYNDIADGSKPSIVLLHSRFRPEDRKRQVNQALAEIKPNESGTIVISTQVIEAGADVSATTLFTELAPWASLVQRFGRCNRHGESNESAAVHWIGLPDEETFKRLHPEKVKAKNRKPKSAKQVKEAYNEHLQSLSSPYELEDLKKSAGQLQKLTDVGLKSLPEVPLPFDHVHVIRRKDLIDLFDTTPDLAGNDIDIDRFVRDIEESDAQIFWRDYGETPNETIDKEAEPAPRREELCLAPIGSEKNPGFRKFAKEHTGHVWRWNFPDKKWERVDAGKITPGQVYLVAAEAGGYLAKRGWDPDSKHHVDPLLGGKSRAPDATDDDSLSRIGIWQTIAAHTDEARIEQDGIVRALSMTSDEAEALRHAARWHDRGKAHSVFQDAIDDGQIVERRHQIMRRRERPEGWRGCHFVAKAPDRRKSSGGQIVDPGFWQRYDWLPQDGRKHFRHELASALSVLDPRNHQIPDADDLRDLVAYLVAAHHGKVRLSIRSLPEEIRPDGHRRFARGIWDDDELPETDLGGGVTAPTIRLSLEPMELGLCEQDPFRGQPSWAERMICLRNTHGPFRLAYLEAILRAADMRASRTAEQREADKQNSETVGERREAVRD